MLLPAHFNFDFHHLIIAIVDDDDNEDGEMMRENYKSEITTLN